jgi:outer membrane protein OmpA-like peptidoglycan-associated protein
LHLLFWVWARAYSLPSSGREVYEHIVPRVPFDRVEIDPKVLAPDPAQDKESARTRKRICRREDSLRKLMADAKGEPASPKIDQSVLSEKPTACPRRWKKQRRWLNGGAQSIRRYQVIAGGVAGKSPRRRPTSGKSSIPQLTGRAAAKTGELRGADVPGFSNLDDLLARTGPLSSETAPILMPTDLLFDYDKTDLRPQALASLEKLGTLIRRNPQAAFVIEGHTDSFGSDTYNLELSRRRAESVKAWLVTMMKIPAGRIDARGYGKSRLIAPASGTIEEQQINRRVEIVIRTN